MQNITVGIKKDAMTYNNKTIIFSSLSLSLATGPFIVTILLLHFLGKMLGGFDKTSEEIFRAEQLPLLNLTSSDNKSHNN